MTASAEAPADTGDIDRMLRCLVEPALAEFTTAVLSLAQLDRGERDVMCAAAVTAVRAAVWPRVSRVVLLELHAARLQGRLTAPDPAARWDEWVDRLARPGGWEALAGPYPVLLPRVRTLVRSRCAAVLTAARRFARDRDRLSGLVGGDPELVEVEFGAGDSHQGGHTVAILRCRGGAVVYKPRSVRVDAALYDLLPRLLPGEPDATRIRVPAVQTRWDGHGEYGWAAHVAHRYCADDGELRAFYRGIGHWLAVTGLLAGSDLHAENLIACGPVPVVVDCETLLAPPPRTLDSGYGAAVDLATVQINRSVLRTGLLPGRAGLLGMRGMDPSGAGSLPDQQPKVRVPAIVDHGTDTAHVSTVTVTVQARANHPSPEPDLHRYWRHVVDAFIELTSDLRERDLAGELAPLLAGFADCPVRVLMRDTTAYGELTRMLWHPASLHKPEPAAEQATALLIRQARNSPVATGDPVVVAAEVADLLAGDVPVFTATPATGEVVGPGDTRLDPAGNLVDAALRGWRRADPATDRLVVQAALVSAYLNDGWEPPREPYTPALVRTGDLDRRRRAQAAAILRQVPDVAVTGDDGTVTWVATIMRPTGWAVSPLGADLYDGGAGVAVLFAGYLREVDAGRADEVPAVAGLLERTVRTLRLADDRQAAERVEAQEAGIPLRPYPPGGYFGLGSRIWGWLLLARLRAVPEAEAVRRAEALASLLPESVAADDQLDLLSGAAGAVVPLLRLAQRTGDDRWARAARDIGHRLGEAAKLSEAGARWPTPGFPEGIGGLSHGVTGVGWALARLAAATGEPGPGALAGAAFGFEESLYDRRRDGWRDIRARPGAPPVARWCHGSVGIGVVAADLLPRDGGGHWRKVLARAARSTLRYGFGHSHTLCHGDLSAWELLRLARRAGVAPAGWEPDAGLAEILTTLEDHGPVAGLARDVFSPALLTGQAGVAYQLLRAHPDSGLPSVLLPDPAVPLDGGSTDAPVAAGAGPTE
jgi:type 2 lantibiotic biosynthesis protein LanM